MSVDEVLELEEGVGVVHHALHLRGGGRDEEKGEVEEEEERGEVEEEEERGEVDD